MQRRSFLKLAAGVATLPLFSIGGTATRAVKDRKIRLGLIGCGGRMGLGTGYGILNNFCDDCEIVCFAEPDPRRWKPVRAVVKAHQPQTDVEKIAGFYDYHEMLDKFGDKLDAVAIAVSEGGRMWRQKARSASRPCVMRTSRGLTTKKNSRVRPQ